MSRNRQIPTKGRLRGNMATHSRELGEQNTEGAIFLRMNKLRCKCTHDIESLRVYEFRVWGLGFSGRGLGFSVWQFRV